MPKTSPNKKPQVLWVRQASPGEDEHHYPMDGGAKHIASESCPCGPTPHPGNAELREPELIWVHRTELERQVVPKHLPDSI